MSKEFIVHVHDKGEERMCGVCHHSHGKGRMVMLAGMAGLGYMLVRQLPDLRRYMKMRSM